LEKYAIFLKKIKIEKRRKKKSLVGCGKD